MARAWAIDQGDIDTAAFFALLPGCFPDATTIFFEGTSMVRETKDCLSRHAERGEHLPGRQTYFPASTRVRCRFSPSLCSELVALAHHHAQPELCDHVFLYRGEEELLGFHDFGGNNIYISGSVPEASVSVLAKGLGLEYQAMDDG